MILDSSGLKLVPRNQGRNCPGNGSALDSCGRLLECCCDECDYMMCCIEEHDMEACVDCSDLLCPHSGTKKPSAEEADG